MNNLPQSISKLLNVSESSDYKDDSILQSIKKLIGITEEYTHFDMNIIIHINTAFMVLNQLGVGPKDGFYIRDETTTWNEYDAGLVNIETIKTYVYLRVRLLFDPPSSSKITEIINKQILELEYRLNVSAESKNS